MTCGVMRAAARVQLAEVRRTPMQLLYVITAPLFSAMFLSVTQNSGVTAANVNAVLAPALIGLWVMSLGVASTIVDSERGAGTLEPILATPARLDVVVLGRVMVIAGIGVATMLESWLVAALGFHVVLVPHHPLVLVATVGSAVLAMTSTATLLAALFVLSRNTHVLQNSLSYPAYVLGGVLLPASVLPVWLRPLSGLVFLSWSADLLRDSFRPGPVAWWWARVLVVLALAAAALLLARRFTGVVVDRVRRTGSTVHP
jgi:ABC-2 type transport system permease protein